MNPDVVLLGIPGRNVLRHAGKTDQAVVQVFYSSRVGNISDRLAVDTVEESVARLDVALDTVPATYR